MAVQLMEARHTVADRCWHNLAGYGKTEPKIQSPSLGVMMAAGKWISHADCGHDSMDHAAGVWSQACNGCLYGRCLSLRLVSSFEAGWCPPVETDILLLRLMSSRWGLCPPFEAGVLILRLMSSHLGWCLLVEVDVLSVRLWLHANQYGPYSNVWTTGQQ